LTTFLAGGTMPQPRERPTWVIGRGLGYEGKRE
jgi:hypothetical protein